MNECIAFSHRHIDVRAKLHNLHPTQMQWQIIFDGLFLADGIFRSCDISTNKNKNYLPSAIVLI